MRPFLDAEFVVYCEFADESGSIPEWVQAGENLVVLLSVWIVSNILNVFVIILGLLLVGLVLLQEGKGGGLTGALGGSTGSTPLGYKSADALVKVTIGFAAVWVFVIILQVWSIQSDARGGASSPEAVILASPLDGN